MDAMILYAGALRDEEISVTVPSLGAGSSKIGCIECNSTRYLTVLPDIGPIKCTTCKHGILV